MPDYVPCNGSIFPRRDLDPDQLKDLGLAADRCFRTYRPTSEQQLVPEGPPWAEQSRAWSVAQFDRELTERGVPLDSPFVSRGGDLLRFVGFVEWFDWHAVQALLAGEFPLPSYLALTSIASQPHLKPEVAAGPWTVEQWNALWADPENVIHPKLSAAELAECKALAGPNAARRVVAFRTRQGEPFTRGAILDALGAFIPRELVEDVVLDGRSWAVP